MPAKEVPQEVEVKLRLLSKDDHDRVVSLLKDSQRKLHHQENFFFDGKQKELSSQRCVLRVRFYNHDEKALVTLKGKMAVVDGIGRADEQEGTIDPSQGRAIVQDPSRLLHSDLPFLQTLFKSTPVQELVCLGGFENIRKEVDWRGAVLEVDETRFDWGTVHEIECETTEPERVRDELEEFLNAHGVQYKHNTTTKFANFIHKTLD